MKPPEMNDTELEKTLARLMPPALSHRAQEEIETMIDQLAATPATSIQRERLPLNRWFLGAGIAASIGALISVVPFIGSNPETSQLAAKPPTGALVTESSVPISTASHLMENSANYSGVDGQVQVRSVGEEISIQISSASGATLFDRQISSSESMDSLPAEWRARVGHLCRALDKTSDPTVSPSREPQPRAIPPQ
jgi:hypothetical protein